MDRDDFIETRDDDIKNIKTLYSYLNDRDDEPTYQWAIDRFKSGRIYVTEIIDGYICFGPIRFIGYKDNTIEKHTENHGDGTQTKDPLKYFYQEVQDERLDQLFQEQLGQLSENAGSKKFWIPNDYTIEDILKHNNYTFETMGNGNKKYWHIQMHLPEGKGGIEIDSMKMLLEPEPVIGTGEWEDIQCVYFKTIPIGSIVLVRKGSEALALCEIIGDNFSDESLESKYLNVNYRKVRILDWAKNYKQPRPALFSQGTFKSCGSSTEQFKYIDGWLKHITSTSFINKCAKLLETKKNIVLQGAPGTGKTYNTAAIALAVLDVKNVDLSDHKEVMIEYGKLKDKQIFFTTFHQSLDYEDFVEGMKPQVIKDGKGNPIGVTYNNEDGIFKIACKAAQEKPVVLIIDEINRGNVSKIFGELITLLEADKRAGAAHPIPVKLAYSKTQFMVPKNLFIIGTMNTTDRSTGTIDYALRRRFAFVTLMSSDKVVEEHYDKKGDAGLKDVAVKLFYNIRDFISDSKHLCGDFDINDLMVGHSYFMAADREELQLKMEYEVVPLINEYINDGILKVSDKEKKAAFEAWKNLKTISANKKGSDAEEGLEEGNEE